MGQQRYHAFFRPRALARLQQLPSSDDALFTHALGAAASRTTGTRVTPITVPGSPETY